MSKNMPILYRNIMDALPSEESREAFLWATDKTTNDRYLYKAEAFAREVASITDTIWLMVGKAGNAHDGFGLSHQIDLQIFMLRRHAHWRFPGYNTAWV